MTELELKEILEKHKKWLNNKEGGVKANLRWANLEITPSYNEGTCFYALQCSEEGSFIGFKKCREDRIVKLLITEDALRSSSTSRKCRASKVKVLEILSIDKKESFERATSQKDNDFEYIVGETIEITNFDEDRWNECSTGIHFFITREEAVQY